MKETLLSIDWKSYGMAALTWLFTMVMLYAIIPNLGKIPTATGKLFDWFRLQAGHVKNQFAAGVLGRLSDMVEYAVLAAENIAISDLKTLAASGKLSPDDLKAALLKVKNDVLDQVKANASAQQLWADALLIFNGNDNLLLKWLESALEAHVAKLPASGLQTLSPEHLELMNSGVMIRTAMAAGNEIRANAEKTKEVPATDIAGAVSKTLTVLLAVFALLFSASAFAQEAPPETPPTAPTCKGLSCLTYHVGPSIPFLEFDPGNTHPVSVVPGAGMQLNLSFDQLQFEFKNKNWDLFSLDLMAFGSLITNNSGQQMGALSVAAAGCVMSGLVCIGGGKHLLETQGGALAGRDGWFMLMAFTFNIIPVLQDGTVEKANSIYLSKPR